MIDWIISSSVLILTVVAIRFILKGKIKLCLQYAIWSLVLVRLLVPINFGNTNFSIMNAAEQSFIADHKITSTVLYYSGADTPQLSIVEQDPNAGPELQAKQYEKNYQAWQKGLEQTKAETGIPITIADVLFTIWIAGITVVALVLLISNLRFAVKLKKTRSRLNTELCPLTVYVSPEVETPCLFGIFKPAVYITSEVADSATVLRHALEHETTHFRHGDHVWSLMRCLCLILHWYNPLVWLAAILSRRDAELACDEGTIKRIGDNERRSYGNTIIDLTCKKRMASALIITATTMTGSKKSIKERIKMIAKKPKMAIYSLLAVILITAAAAGCTFTGSKANEPCSWAQKLNLESITSVELLNSGEELSKDSIEVLISLLNDLQKNNFTENPHFTGGTPTYGLIIKTVDGTYYLNESIAPAGSLELIFNDKLWWIDSSELSDFVVNVTSAEEKKEIGINLDNNFPEAVINYAVDYVREIVDSWNNGTPINGNAITVQTNKIIKANIVGLTQISTGTAGLNSGEQLWLLEYRLLPENQDNIALAGGRQLEILDGKNWFTEWGSYGQPYLLLHYDNSGDKTVWQRICATNTITMQEDYATPEMLKKYGNMYTAASIELYNRYLNEVSSAINNYIINLLSSDGAYTETALDSLINSLITHPTETFEAIGLRDKGIENWLCWMIADNIKGRALDTGDALNCDNLTAKGRQARDLIVEYLSTDTASPKNWQNIYLDFWNETVSEMAKSGKVTAIALLDLQSDGVPELVLLMEKSVLYYTDGIAVYRNQNNIFKDALTDSGYVLSVEKGDMLNYDTFRALINSWRTAEQ